MPNRWTEFVKDWASKNNTTYGCALSKPDCKNAYHKKYPKPLTKKQQKEREGLERGSMGQEDINRARPKPKKEAKEAFKMTAEDISSRKANKEWNKQAQENIRMSIEDVNVAKKPKKKKPVFIVEEDDEEVVEAPTTAGKRGRKPKYATAEERKQAKREQTLASNKRMADMRKEYLQQAREQIAMGKEDKKGKGLGGSKMKPTPLEEQEKRVAQLEKKARELAKMEALLKKPKKKDAEGKGILKDIRKGLKKVGRKTKNTFEDIGKAVKIGADQAVGFAEKTAKDVEEYGKAVIFGRMDYPPKVRGILKKFGDEVVVGYKIKRTPVSSLLTSALSAVSLGKFGARFGRSEYDELFHLFLEMRTASGKNISVEKNEVINMDTSPPKRDKEEVKDIVNNVRQDLTINEIMANTEASMGKKNFFGYSARDNNCQDFIVALLKSNNIGDAEDIAFVKQNTKELFRNLPFLRKFSNTITDIGARVNVITTGAGVELIKGSKEIILPNNIKRMPRFAKGSKEAKEWGAMMRAKRMKGGSVIHPPMSSVEASRPMYKTMEGDGMCGGRVFCPHCETSMEGGRINIGRAFKKLGSDIKKGFNKEIAKPITKKVINPAGDYITSKKGGLATDLIKYGIPAASSALLGGLATAATGGNPVAGVAASALGSKLGSLGAKELQKATGTGMRKGRFAKGSQEAKDYMASLRAKRMK